VATPHAVLFSDDFETGDLSKWTVNGLTAQQALVFGGAWGARATSTGAAASATASLSPAMPKADVRVRFQLVSQGVNTVNLFRLRSAANAAVLTASLSSTGKLQYRNELAGTTATSTLGIAPGGWHELQLHVDVGGGAVETWLDGNLVPALSQPEALGSASLAKLELGDASTGRSFDVAFDDVLVDSAAIADTTPPTSPSNVVATAVTQSEVDVTWTAATDNQSVAGYDIARDGVVVATVGGGASSFADTSVAPSTTYAYTVRAFDGAGNRSAYSLPASATTPAAESTSRSPFPWRRRSSAPSAPASSSNETANVTAPASATAGA
jgi:chitodextrinase